MENCINFAASNKYVRTGNMLDSDPMPEANTSRMGFVMKTNSASYTLLIYTCVKKQINMLHPNS